MRQIALLLAPLLACSEPDARIEPAVVVWMEWPAEVAAAKPFGVRLVMYSPGGCQQAFAFESGPTIDQSAVTFEPYFRVSGERYPCRELVAPSNSIAISFLDTSATVLGLDAQFPRSFEMRAGTDVYSRLVAGSRQVASTLPVRTFGDITVRNPPAAGGRVNAGGMVNAMRDSTGCVKVQPYGLYPGYVVENPSDTALYWTAFVRGYIYEPAAPVCGETRVFHLMTLN